MKQCCVVIFTNISTASRDTQHTCVDVSVSHDLHCALHIVHERLVWLLLQIIKAVDGHHCTITSRGATRLLKPLVEGRPGDVVVTELVLKHVENCALQFGKDPHRQIVAAWFLGLVGHLKAA